MSALSIHPIEYLRLHAHYEGGWTRGRRLLVKKVFELLEQAATIAVVLLTAGLVIFSCMIIVQSALFADSYNSVITEVVFPPLQASPTGMYPFSTFSL